jgi:hypothetical protein
MTEPTEAEVEAAALAFKRWSSGNKNAQLDPQDSPWGKYERNQARAALTAAAQVRERADRGRSLTAEESGLVDRALTASTEPTLMPIYGATEDLAPDAALAEPKA